MAYKAQPSFLIAPDSSGHQFYSARLFTRNPLTNQLDRLVGRIAESSCEPACNGRVTAPASSLKTSAGRSR